MILEMVVNEMRVLISTSAINFSIHAISINMTKALTKAGIYLRIIQWEKKDKFL